MAGQKFEYDESGSTFFYFITSFLGLVLVPCTFYFWPAEELPAEDPEKKKEECQCDGCRSKKERLRKPAAWKGWKKQVQRALIVLGWAFMLFLMYKVQQFDYEYANFDPYDILGIGPGTSSADVKKAYRKLSLILHPDKPTGDERKFMRLNKAYQALTDDVARRNYELYGHPDGPGSMQFGIALPSWIIEKENSIWVLGLYGLVFMVALPSVVAVWWYRSSKFSNDQVLLDTTQLYYFFFHKTPHMVFKRALMILAASLEFEKGHNPEIIERPTDNVDIPLLIKQLPNLGEKNKERPLCFAYSIKARALLHAHLSRMMRPGTADIDRLYIVKCCPTLIQEMVTCVSQLIMLAHAGRISRLPTLETIESCMRLSPHIVQALWESKNPLLQLPHLTEDSLRHFVNKRRHVKTIQQLVQLSADDRRQCLKGLTDEQYNDVMKVCKKMPYITIEVSYEVVDDDDSGVFTAGAIVTVTVLIKRRDMAVLFDQEHVDLESKPEDSIIEEQKDEPTKKSGWKKPQPKKSSRSKGKQQPQKKKQQQNNSKREEQEEEKKEEEKKEKTQPDRIEEIREDGESDEEDSASHSDESQAEEADTESHKEDKHDDDDDAEWEKFQKGLTKREKALEGKSKISHSVHCPYFTEDKQEFWWVYVSDRKKHMVITAPYQVTNLVDQEEVQLKFTAPHKPGNYTYAVCIRSDSYMGFDHFQDIKLDVKEAREIPTEHPQWEECEEEEEEDDDDKQEDDDSEFTTDEELTDESDEE
ncbi:translocation protein Sec63 isoform X2 [Oratosquilla oratoria]|uniref:translocation protein Sec63 isoform X2 n=1 Tax=Oratosquilla oratoria TaxID=337810 RepID=UPI003F75BBA7